MSDTWDSPAEVLNDRLRLGAGFGPADRGHVLELIRNIFKGLTNPYQVREVLILANSDFLLDPGYDFVFQGAESARA